MVEVRLAGYNLPIEIIDAFKKYLETGDDSGLKKYHPEDLTPESISVANARVSRDPRSVTELRQEALESPEARAKSLAFIVQKLDHKSVAEHSYLNFDILGVSRLVVEDIERHRLASYTEKSQRYIKLNSGDESNMPEEFIKAGIDDDFSKLNEAQFALYVRMLEKEIPAEDVRYLLSMNTKAQLGMSAEMTFDSMGVNARELEHMIGKMRGSPLAETREVGEQLWELAHKVVPNMIAHADPETHKKVYGTELKVGFYQNSDKDLEQAVNTSATNLNRTYSHDVVELVDPPKNIDRDIIAALLFRDTDLHYNDAKLNAEKWLAKSLQVPEVMLKKALQHLSEFDSVFREFELADLVYDITLSSSAFAQLKRHRMMTLITKGIFRYDVELGYICPQTIKKAGMEDEFAESIHQAGDFFKKARSVLPEPQAAFYALTNAHMRNVIVKCNLRELYAISRLRQDAHAQWEIRNIADEMVKQAKKVAPLTTMLLCGKDRFAETRKEVYGEK